MTTENNDFNRRHALEGLLLVRDICSCIDLSYYLGFGTLLGAVRNNDFIPWDNDVDIIFFKKDRKKIFSLVKSLEEKGAEVKYLEPKIISVDYKSIQIDLYIFSEGLFYSRCLNWSVPKSSLKGHSEIEIRSHFFATPNNPHKLLENLYGRDWMIPKKGFKPPWTCKLDATKRFLMKYFPKFYFKLKNYLLKKIDD